MNLASGEERNHCNILTERGISGLSSKPWDVQAMGAQKKAHCM